MTSPCSATTYCIAAETCCRFHIHRVMPWRAHVIASHMGRQQIPAAIRAHLLNRPQYSVAADPIEAKG
ncbi:MAG TPA: hypothetical protein VG456_06530 [Candidatus Sulfopaludibacter sp.]|nr:hypothetical protein [Candidatus Sulfopaludibacter sp.]